MAHIARIARAAAGRVSRHVSGWTLLTCQRRLKEWRREAALQLVFGTVLADANAAVGDTDYPVDSPLRLDDAVASPTTPQDLQQQQF
jgi:hypothetical protein